MHRIHRFFAISLAACCAQVAVAQDADVAKAARYVLSGLQSKSFASNREYCGFIGEDPNGQLISSAPRRGRRDSCRPRLPRGGDIEPLASFHTHAAHDVDADSEVPSSRDVIADMDDGVDGFVATPGGRFWFIDGIKGTVSLLCGPGCLPQDPNYDPRDVDTIADFYTLDALERREAY